MGTMASAGRRAVIKLGGEDHADADRIGNVGARVAIARTRMTSLHEREMLARVTLDVADAMASQR